MAAPQLPQLVITTVYSASEHGRAGPARSRPMQLLGLTMLAACGIWTYACWWKIDNYVTGVSIRYGLDEAAGHVLKLTAVVTAHPSPDGPDEGAAGEEGQHPDDDTDAGPGLGGSAGANTGPPRDAAAKPPELLTGLVQLLTGGPPPAGAGPRVPKLTAAEIKASADALAKRGRIYGICLYGWFTLATISALLMATAGGAALVGRRPAPGVRPVGLTVAVAGLAALLGYAGWKVLPEYGAGWPVEAPRYAVILGLVTCAGLGVLFSLGGRGLHKLAAGFMLLTAAGTCVALYTATHLAGLQDPAIDTNFYLRALLLQVPYPIAVLLILKAIR